MYKNRLITRLPDESLREGLVKADPELILSMALKVLELTFQEANSKSRSFKLVFARHIIHYLLSVDPDRSFEDIGKVFTKDHATILNSRKVVENMIETNHEFKLKIILISTRIKNQNES